MIDAPRDVFACKPAAAAHQRAVLALEDMASVGVMGLRSVQAKTEHPTAP